MSDKTFTSKLGTTRAGPRTRIWLEGKRLLDHGFTNGHCVKRQWSEGKLVLSLVLFGEWQALPREERTTVAGTRERPIIDIAAERVAQTFKGATVKVAYREGRITITESD